MKFPVWTLSAAVLAGSVSACSTIPAAPVVEANKTTLDERLGIGAEVSYTTATKLGTALARAGLIDKDKFKALDNEAYSALLSVREAYKAGNASDYSESILHVQAVVQRVQRLVEGS